MINPLDFTGEVAVVTGAASGMGLATAQAFAEARAAVVLADFKEDALEAAAQQLVAAGHKALAIPCDVGNKMRIKIGTKTFPATLYDNATAAAFKSLLPMTVNMDELNGNEKKFDLQPADAEAGEFAHVGLALEHKNRVAIFSQECARRSTIAREGKCAMCKLTPCLKLFSAPHNDIEHVKIAKLNRRSLAVQPRRKSRDHPRPRCRWRVHGTMPTQKEINYERDYA